MSKKKEKPISEIAQVNWTKLIGAAIGLLIGLVLVVKAVARVRGI